MLPPAARAARTLGAALAGAAIVASCAAPGAEHAGADPATTTTTTEPVRRVPDPVAGALSTYVAADDEATGDELLLFGDSVAVLIADDLVAELDRAVVVDAVDCRRLDLGFAGPCGGVPAGTDVAPALDDLAAAVADLHDPATTAAVVVLANNAALRAQDLDAAMRALAPVPRVWWVTTTVEGRAWRDPNNALLADLAARDPRAGLVDWFAESQGRDHLADHVHPDDAGQAALARLVAEHVRCDCTP